jgi:hypothetical protein
LLQLIRADTTPEGCLVGKKLEVVQGSAVSKFKVKQKATNTASQTNYEMQLKPVEVNEVLQTLRVQELERIMTPIQF